MRKKIVQIGNFQGILLDNETMRLSGLKEGDEMSVEVASNGAITFTPLDPERKNEEVSDEIRDAMKRYSESMERLA